MYCTAAAVRNSALEGALFRCLCCSGAKELSTLGPVVDLGLCAGFRAVLPRAIELVWVSKLLSGAGVMLCWDTQVFLWAGFNWNFSWYHCTNVLIK